MFNEDGKMKKFICNITTMLFVAILVIGVVAFINTQNLSRDKVLILSDGNNNVSMDRKYKSVLETLSIPAEIITENKLQDIELASVKALIIPQRSAGTLEPFLQDKIISGIKDGLGVLTESKSELAEKLGINYSGEEYVVSSVYFNRHPELIVSWPEGLNIDRFTQEDMRVFCYDGALRVPVVAGGTLGKGNFIYLATSLEEENKQGFSRYLFLHEILMQHFQLKSVAKRDDLIIYLDWGYYWDENPIRLARKIKEYGISQVHFSSWYEPGLIDSVLPQFIDECHKLGIRVYCWLELPMVSTTFWDKHPEWRERTATGLDAHIDWRYLMALENPQCFHAVCELVQEILCRYDWDGVDLAEIYFESPALGYKAPERFTPMSEFVRKDYHEKYGIDPILLFNPESKYFYEKNEKELERFSEYRIALCSRLNKEMIQFLQKKDNFNKELDVIVTQIDTIFADSMRIDTGVDSKAFLSIQDDLAFTLQVEDPFILWLLGPDRYAKLGSIYRKYMAEDKRINVDINVVNRMNHIYPHTKQTGMEFLMLLSEAARSFNGVCVYSLNSVNEFDYTYSPYAVAAGIRIEKLKENTYRTFSENSFTFCRDIEQKSVYVNNRLWPCINSEGIIVPAGYNTIAVREEADDFYDVMKIINVNGNIKDCYYRGTDIVLKYNDNRNVYVTLNKRPYKVLLDGKEEKVKIYAGEERTTVKLPRGENEVIIKSSI